MVSKLFQFLKPTARPSWSETAFLIESGNQLKYSALRARWVDHLGTGLSSYDQESYRTTADWYTLVYLHFWIFSQPSRRIACQTSTNGIPKETIVPRSFSMPSEPLVRRRPVPYCSVTPSSPFLRESTTGEPLRKILLEISTNIPQWEFKCPIYNENGGDDNAEFYIDPPSQSGRRAQDFYLGKIYLALRGRSKKVGAIFNEAMSRSGIKQERPPCGRAFTVNVHGKTYFVALGNRAPMWRSRGADGGSVEAYLSASRRTGCSYRESRFRRISQIVIPTEQNLLGISNAFFHPITVFSCFRLDRLVATAVLGIRYTDATRPL